MNAPLLERFCTPDELLTLPDEDRYELLDGRLVEKTSGAQSSHAGVRLISLLASHADDGQLGLVFGGRCGYQLFPDRPNRIRLPDASFIRRERLPKGELPEGHFHMHPDLAVEAISPDDHALDVDETVDEYLRAEVCSSGSSSRAARSSWFTGLTGASPGCTRAMS